MRWVRRLIGLGLIGAVMVLGWQFASENANRVAVHYLWGILEIPIWQALIGAFGLGFAFAGLGWFFFGVRAGMVQRRYRKTVGGLESEIHQLRNLPLAEDSSGAPAAPDAAAGDGSR
ncbi:MAG: LapA family protein [Myxococcota bacterium]